MKKFLTFLLLFLQFALFSQKKYNKKFSIFNDNDLYISTSQDRYYTNGLFLNYNYLSTLSKTKYEKKIYTISLGHQMYTPYKATVVSLKQHDRPFAGYLYGKFGISKFYKSKEIIRYSVESGTLGSYAFGKELQEIIHRIYGFRESTGWKYQIKNAFALNMNFQYIKPLQKEKQQILDFYWVNNINAGSVFSDISTGFLSRIGLKPLQDSANSVAFNSNLNNDTTAYNNEVELFISIKPELKYVVYDATIQGSFLNTKSPITFDIMPFVFSTELGISGTYNRFNLGYKIIYHSKKLRSINVPEGNFYGNIHISYQFN